jgi:hypothetical protein
MLVMHFGMHSHGHGGGHGGHASRLERGEQQPERRDRHGD